MWLGIGSLSLAGLCLLLDTLLATSAAQPRSDAFLIVNGLVALVELSSCTVAGIAAIGWVVSRSLAKRT